MITVTVSELCSNARKYLEAVERGETVQVVRGDKPVATVAPAEPQPVPRWKLGEPMRIPGASLSKHVLQEREEGW